MTEHIDDVRLNQLATIMAGVLRKAGGTITLTWEELYPAHVHEFEFQARKDPETGSVTITLDEGVSAVRGIELLFGSGPEVKRRKAHPLDQVFLPGEAA